MPALSALTESASAALPGPLWLAERRATALADARAAGLPSSEEEVWRYSRIDDLDLASFGEPVASTHQVSGSGAVLLTDSPHGEAALGSVAADGPDVFAQLNTAFADAPLLVEVGRGASVAEPIVITHRPAAPGIAFPRLVIRAGEGCEVTVVEHFTADDQRALVVPLTEIDLGRGARVAYVAVQDLPHSVWQVANLVVRVGQEATFLGAAAALGGDYTRLRTDCRLEGRGASGDLVAAYFGDGHQSLDFRTFQDHRAPDTTSNLVFKGAVDDHSRSIYTGLIKVRPDARGTNAFQTNRNIKLSEHAWAESVPNLEIENNDVHCSHASTVGPIDDEQRFYLESRGVPPRVAERLVVSGFFDEVLARIPVDAVRDDVRAGITAKLDRRDRERVA